MKFDNGFFSVLGSIIKGVVKKRCSLIPLCALALALNTNAAPALSGVAQIAMDGGHSCALMQNKTVQCWGANNNGQLGNGSNISSEFPVLVSAISDAFSIEVFGDVTCALTGGGQIKCWGFLSAGYLDKAIEQPSVTARTPTTINGLSGVSAFGLLWGRLCAVVAGGAVQCIGGDAGPNPISIPGLRNATKVVVGLKHACALLDIGTVHCWGANSYGQLGDGSATGSSNTSNVPVPVSGLSGVIALTASSDTTCAVTRPGSVFCWGTNLGLFGNGNNLGSNTPVRVGSLDDAISISAGSGHICALRRGGGVACWGANHDGNGLVTSAVGGPEKAPINLPPTTVEGVGGAVNVAVGRLSAQSCAIFADSTVGCWGTFLSPDRSTRLEVRGLTEVASINAGRNHNCAVQTSGSVFCWGDNAEGQLGNGTERSSGAPVRVLDLPPAVSVAAGQSHSCATAQDLRARCWGSNAFGQLGDGTLVNRGQAVLALSSSSVRAVTAGGAHSCSLLFSGAVQCWGEGRHGELGDGRSASSSVPVVVSGITNAVAIAASESSTCAVLVDGTVWCWGFDRYGSLGTIPTTSSVVDKPARMSGLANVQTISASTYDRFCTSLRDGGVFCWGSNLYGEAGGPGFVAGVAVPVQGIVNAIGIAAGGLHTCVALSTGQVKCWGLNERGQLGNGTRNNTRSPINVAGLSNASALAAGSRHSCALRSDATVACWGENYYGQLGDGRKGFSSTPQRVLAAPKRLTMTEFLFVPLNYYFMTSRDSDKALLDSLPDWRRSGESFLTYAENEPDTSAANRFYFDRVAKNESRGSHFYTALESEKAALRTQNPSNLALPKKPLDEGIDSFAHLPVVEGIGGLCATGQLPVYRAFRGNARYPDDPNHRFTTDVATYNSLVSSGWTAEGVKLCVSNVP
jgi:alpha-tubulin suppressor-like RCC1 family protein